MYGSGNTIKIFVPLIVIGAVNSGCAFTRHNDVLVFATQTSFGVNLSSNSTSQLPQVSIGYKRDEGVWMPLIINGAGIEKDNVSIDCEKVEDKSDECKPSTTDNLKYRGRSTKTEVENKNEKTITDESDTYSVFASFGGTASGGSEGADAGVAQFFATGIAAQRLGHNDNAYKLLTSENVSTAVANEAIKRADAEKERANTINQQLTMLTTEKEKEDALTDGEKYQLEKKANIETIISRLEAADDFSAKLGEIVDKAVTDHQLDSAKASKIKSKTDRAGLASYLSDHDGVIKPLLNALNNP